MREILENCRHTQMTHVRNLVLLDTCFFINFLEHHADMHLVRDKTRLATTSFNVDELLHVEHHLSHELKSRIREFLKDTDLLIVDIPVSPGDWDAERLFVGSIDDKLLANVPDPSDAVLAAVAIRTGSCIVTKDKHHLFTVKLEKFLKPYNIMVYKDLKFLGS